MKPRTETYCTKHNTSTESDKI